MSRANCSAVTWSGGSSDVWQSRHVFCACAEAVQPQTDITSSRKNAPARPLFCNVSIDRHCDHVAERKDSCTHDESPAASPGQGVEKRKKQPQETGHTKDEDAYKFTVHKPHLGRNLLERLEHEHEIPLRPDAGRRGGKRVGLCSQVP